MSKPNAFSTYAQKREAEQAEIEKTVTGKESVPKKNPQDEERIRFSLSITVQDKEALRKYAYDHHMKIAEVIHELVQNHIINKDPGNS